MAQNKVIPIVVAASLCGCSPAEEANIAVDDGYIIISEDTSGVVQQRPEYFPLVTLFVQREPSDSLKKCRWEVNGSEFEPDSVDTVLGRTWDRDDILPEGVTDMFSVFVPNSGEVSVMLIAKYNSGKEYRPQIKYTY